MSLPQTHAVLLHGREEDVLVKLKLSQFMVKRLSPSKPQKIRELEERAKARLFQ